MQPCSLVFSLGAAAGTWAMAKAMSTTHPVDTPEAASKAILPFGPFFLQLDLGDIHQIK